MDQAHTMYHKHIHTELDYHLPIQSDPAAYNILPLANNTGNDYNTIPFLHPHTVPENGMELNSFHLMLPTFLHAHRYPDFFPKPSFPLHHRLPLEFPYSHL